MNTTLQDQSQTSASARGSMGRSNTSKNIVCTIALFSNMLAHPATATSYEQPILPKVTVASPQSRIVTRVPEQMGSSGNAILEVRRLSGLTWDELAKVFGVTRRTLHHWANGKPLMSQNEQHLHRVLGVIRHIDRGQASHNRRLLFAVGPDGQMNLDLLKTEHFDEMIARIGAGKAERRVPYVQLSPEEQRARRPAAPADLLGALQDRLPETSQVLVHKSVRRPVQ